MAKKIDTSAEKVNQPIWEKSQIEKVKAWLKSDKGIAELQKISSTSPLTASFEKMTIISPEQLREPYTI